MSSGGEKTESATPKKILDLRKKGQVARSQDLPAGAGLLALVLLLPTGISRAAESLSTGMVVLLSLAGDPDVTLASAVHQGSGMGRSALTAMLPMIAITAGTGILAAALVAKSKPNPWALKPKFASLSPKNGVKRLLSPQSGVDALRASTKLAMLGLVAYTAFTAGYAKLTSGYFSLDGFLGTVDGTLHEMLKRIGILALLVGLADAAYSRKKFGKQSRMTKHEVKEEGKSAEGNPHLKAARRQKAQQLSRGRMIDAIAGADVVLVNPTHIAVALKYTPGKSAPVVVAKGAGVVAERIKDEARKHRVAIVTNIPVARALFRSSEIGDVIPAELFHAVAEVLAAVFRARRPRLAARSTV